MSIEELRKTFEKFCENNDFQLNLDQEHTDTALKGVLENEEKTGFKFCPCQIQTGDFSKDIQLLCPCNFKSQKTWQEKGECWCGLFVKK
jgi:ferredoxin-thioredoxin reductase catalytic subunit